MELLIDKLGKTKTNQDFLNAMSKGPEGSDSLAFPHFRRRPVMRRGVERDPRARSGPPA